MRVETFTPFSLNIDGILLEFSRPQVMGILNVTPDSFYATSRAFSKSDIAIRVKKLLDDGTDMIDIGAYSSRPGANDTSVDEELSRLVVALEVVHDIAPDTIISIDTFRAEVAHETVNSYGANIINDISGGTLDEKMFQTIAQLNVPYILMHMRGTPATMSTLTDYHNVTADVIKDLSSKVNTLSLLGVNDVIIDPGFGFGKTLEQNFELMRNISSFQVFGCPILVGISRKSMIYRSLDITPEESLNGTTVLNTIALTSGASILRVHDPKETRQAIELMHYTYNS